MVNAARAMVTGASALEQAQDELATLVARALPQDGHVNPIGPVHMYRTSAPGDPVHGVYDPSLCVVAQGRKQLLLGDDRRVYDADHYFLNSVALPVVVQVVQASKARPYLCVGIQLDPALISSVLVEAGLPEPLAQPPLSAVDVSLIDFSLLDAVVRLVRLLDSPEDARVLAPLVLREIVYRLLMGAQSARLRQIASLGGQTRRIARAIEWLRHNFDKPMRIETLGKDLGLSPSGLHAHFRSVTGMSPLQYQKKLRLQEARRLMLTEHLDAASAGFRVGYNDASQFNREYRRMFGAPPSRDVAQIRRA
jgi:AraC-like DNA-binding protein